MATVEHEHDREHAATEDVGKTLEQKRDSIAQAIEQAPQNRHAQELATQQGAAQQLLDRAQPADRDQVGEILDRQREGLEQTQKQELELGRQALDASAQIAQPQDALRSLEDAVQQIGELHAAEQTRIAAEQDELDKALSVLDDQERGRRLDAVERQQARTPDELLEVLRNQEPERDSARAGWDHDRFPEGVGRTWAVGDPVDMPTKNEEYPDYKDQKIQQRYWRNAADVELQLRGEGKATREPAHELADVFQPLRSLDDARLEQLRRDGTLRDVGLQGWELEHKAAPQRAAKLFEEAGIPADESRRLAHTADPANLMVVHESMHAAMDREAANKTSRNEQLKEDVVAQERGERPTVEPDEETKRQLADATVRGDLETVGRLSAPYERAVVLDDRTRDEPLRSMTHEQFAALERAAATYRVEERAKEGDERARALVHAMDDWRASWENRR